MSDKNILTFLKIIENVLYGYLERTVNLIRLATLEVKLTTRAIRQLFTLYFIFGLLLFSTWLCLLTAIFTALLVIQHSILIASLGILGFNLILLVIIWLFILKTKKNMFFPATRRQLNLNRNKPIKKKAVTHERYRKKSKKP